MANVRIIPRLDIKGPNLVKGIHLEGLRVLGQPEDFARYYYENGADELMFQDVVASLFERNSLSEIITKTAKQIFIPLTVGGGLRTIEDMQKVLRAGADKVAINTAAIKDPEIIKKASRKFGSSTIVVTIEAIKETNGQYLAYTDNGRDYTGVDVVEWAEKVADFGAGEIVITSVDKEGTGEGFDCELVKSVLERVSIPVIAHGGAGNAADVERVIRQGKADAVSIASMLHYSCISSLDNAYSAQSEEGNTEFLKNKKSFLNFEPIEIEEVKRYLNSKGISTRR